MPTDLGDVLICGWEVLCHNSCRHFQHQRWHPSWSVQKKKNPFIHCKETWILNPSISFISFGQDCRSNCRRDWSVNHPLSFIPNDYRMIDSWRTLQSLSKHGLNSAARFVDLHIQKPKTFIQHELYRERVRSPLSGIHCKPKDLLACILDARL